MQRPPRFDPDAAARRVRSLRTYNPAPLPSSCWAFVSQSDCGSGLFARAALKPEQAVCEYGGPRMPLSLCPRGEYVLQIPGSSVCIDGKGENSPYHAPFYLAPFANHSWHPNARLEYWPSAKGLTDLGGKMWLVATESIEKGREIRPVGPPC